MSLNKDELSNVLDQILDHMLEKGIQIEPFRDQLKKILQEDLGNSEISREDLKDPEVKKKLFACVTELLINGKSKDYDNLVDDLKTHELKNAPDEKLDNKLLAQLLFLTALTKIIEHEINKKMVLTPDEFKKHLDDHIDKKFAKEDKPEAADELKSQLEFLMRSFYGVGKAGEQGVMFEVGNQFGIPNVTQSGRGVAFLIDANTYDSNKSDYLGLENAVKVNQLVEGVNLDPHVSPKMTPL